MAETCKICDERGISLISLRKAAVTHEHERLLEIRVHEGGFPRQVVKYHRLCRARFTLKKNAEAGSTENNFNATVSGKRTRSESVQGGFHLLMMLFGVSI